MTHIAGSVLSTQRRNPRCFLYQKPGRNLVLVFMCDGILGLPLQKYVLYIHVHNIDSSILNSVSRFENFVSDFISHIFYVRLKLTVGDLKIEIETSYSMFSTKD